MKTALALFVGIALGAAASWHAFNAGMAEHIRNDEALRHTSEQLRDACNTRPQFRRRAWGTV